MLNQNAFAKMTHLPKHLPLCRQLFEYFFEKSEISGGFISGSGASGGMDFHSDLDLGFVCESNEAKERIWSERLNWDLPPWFHRMDADHVKPYFIIYLFEPHIHVDLCFYTMENLPPQAGGPFSLAFDKRAQLDSWVNAVNAPISDSADWSNVVHEEERFWTWTHYSWCHTGRGEYYDDASTFHIMRNLVQTWHARLQGNARFETRRLEQRGGAEFISRMVPCFPKPDRGGMKAALIKLIEIHNGQRDQVERLLAPRWTTTQSARDKITRLVQEI